MLRASSGGLIGSTAVNSRSRIARIAAASVLALAAAGAPAACGPSAAPPPNVLLVVMDTTRADRCSLLGYGRPTTPVLDALARESAVFEDCWSPSSWTAPAHATLFTGLLPRNHGLHNGATLFLDERRTTVAEILRDAGWRTGCFTNNPFISPDHGLSQGFETTDLRFRDAARPYPWAPATTEATLAWIDGVVGEGRPFFAFVSDMEPHAPYTPPTDLERRFAEPGLAAGALARARTVAFPESLGMGLGAVPLPPEIRRAMSSLYDAEIASVDAALGPLFEGLRSRGLLDSTVVVVTSDHGEGLGDHGWVEHANYLWRELLRVPLLVRRPGRFDGGRRVKDVVRLEDVAPTILELCGRKDPGGLDGIPLTRGLPGRVALGSENASDGIARTAEQNFPGVDVSSLTRDRRSVFDGRWHLVLTEGGTAHLFDVAADPAEERDLAQEQPSEVERLKGLAEPMPRR